VRRIGPVEVVRHDGPAGELHIGQEEEGSSAVHIGLVPEVGTVPAVEVRCTGQAAAHYSLQVAAVHSLVDHTDLEEGHVPEAGRTGSAAHYRGLVVAVGRILVGDNHLAVHRTVGFALVVVDDNFVVEVVDIAQAVRILVGILEGISRRSASAPSAATGAKDA
jgi:hypothetical protein